MLAFGFRTGPVPTPSHEPLTDRAGSDVEAKAVDAVSRLDIGQKMHRGQRNPRCWMLRDRPNSQASWPFSLKQERVQVPK